MYLMESALNVNVCLLPKQVDRFIEFTLLAIDFDQLLHNEPKRAQVQYV